MSHELHEMHEHAEHGREHPSMAPITLTMAILAVGVAVVTLLGHRANTEEVVLHSRSSNQWSHYQAKNIRMHSDKQFAELIDVMPVKNAVAARTFQEENSKEAERYQEELKELEVEGHHRPEPGQ